MTDVRELVLDAPGRNALSTEHMTRLLAEIHSARESPLVVCGAGSTFSAGLNLKEVAALDHDGATRFLLLLDDLMDALFTHPAPTVACVNGHAIAGGCVLALCCDVRVAVDDPAVRIGLNEVPLGLEFPPKILALVRARVPAHALDRVLLDGALHAPRMALALGLVDEVAAGVEVVARARMERLAAHPRTTYVATKRALRAGRLDLSPADRQRFRDVVVPAWCTAEVRARVEAALRPRG